MKSKPQARPPEPQLPVASEQITAEEALLEALPESERWDPVPGSAGHQAPTNPSVDEDAEGRSQNEQLVEDGLPKAKQKKTGR